jgi:hypothetical protein
MRRSLPLAAAALAAAIGFVLLRWKSSRDESVRAALSAAIRNVVDPTREKGWVETFDLPRSQPLSEYDPRWVPLFGRLLVDARLGAVIGDPEGGWERDGGDDYAFRTTDLPVGNVEVVVDGWWDGKGSLGIQGAVQPEPPHRLYEATLWRGRLTLIYFVGPGPDQFEILAESPEPPVRKGHYRIVLRMERESDSWALRARLLDPTRLYAVIAQAVASDSRLPDGGYGIGLLGGGGPKSSHITGIAIRQLGNNR